MGTRAIRRLMATMGALSLALTMAAGTAGAANDEPVVSFGPSDADSIALLSGAYYVNSNQAGGLPFWWDHTELTIAVLTAPNVDPDNVQALHDAIAVWSSVLADRLPDISLTDLSADGRSPQHTDIVVHLVPHAGGVVWGGSSVCGSQKCMNVMVRSDEPPGQLGRGITDFADFDPLRVQREAVHEIGHALGLGHAAPLLDSIDIMGYGWALVDPDVTPILSDCDIRGIETAFGWFYNHETPHASSVPEVIC
jgi:hypothetical protein